MEGPNIPSTNTPAEAASADSIDSIAGAMSAIGHITAVQARVTDSGALWIHLEWTKEALWAAAYPGSVDDSILNALEVTAEQAE